MTEQENTVMTVTLVLAIWGAILSTILATLRIIDFRRGNARIKVSVAALMDVVSINIVNVSRSRIIIPQVGLIMPRRCEEQYLVPENCDFVELGEGDNRVYNISADDVRKLDVIPNKCVAYAVDTTDRVYYSHGVLIRLFRLRRIR